MSNWKDGFDDRELKEIEFCQLYMRNFQHGTDGHHMRIIIAKMAVYLDAVQKIADEEDNEVSHD